MPRVSVILPSYNHAIFLEKRIKSILNQTCKDFELIILDDCSTDNSREVIEQYHSEPKITQIIYNDSNSGSTFKQWQKGIEYAKGDYIWIAESDDWCEPGFLEVGLQFFLSDPSIVLAYCQSKVTNEADDILDNMLWWTDDLGKKWELGYKNNGADEIKNCLTWKNTIPNASAVVFARSAYNKVNRNFTEMRYCGDWMLWINLLLQGNIAFCPQPLNYFRNHSSTTRMLDTSLKVRRRAEEEYAILKFIEKNVQGISEENLQLRRKIITSAFSDSYTKKEFLQIITNPFRYKSTIPFSSYVLNYIESKLKK